MNLAKANLLASWELLLCRWQMGKLFSVGSGLTDKERDSPPKVGTIITYRYQNLTEDGVPRFPSYVGERIDATVGGDGAKEKVLSNKEKKALEIKQKQEQREKERQEKQKLLEQKELEKQAKLAKKEQEKDEKRTKKKEKTKDNDSPETQSKTAETAASE
eukprot:TRINITY_DN4483_c0_g1_i3.p1 TRINITY_DN4483_c0_g1~~TRINITY_DN4483_c0_g1_i3.p1  ORF type:complete len:160 (+),score=48.71 TRINITY_DN4483_c0_g1_i3:234-713(+)